MTEIKKSTQEKDYSAVLCRTETKEKLQQFRRSLPNRDLNQERRLVTACLEYCLSDVVAQQKILALVQKIVIADVGGMNLTLRDNETN